MTHPQDELLIKRERIVEDGVVRFTSATRKGVIEIDEASIASDGWPVTMQVVYEHFDAQPAKTSVEAKAEVAAIRLAGEDSMRMAAASAREQATIDAERHFKP